MDSVLISGIVLLIGWILDRLFGDPIAMPHPIVWYGKLIAWGERRLNKGQHRLCRGAFWTIVLVGGIYGLSSYLLPLLLDYSEVLYVVVASFLVFTSLSGKTLITEVRLVFEAVDRSLEEGRLQVARIVGRDTSELTAQEVRTAALETLAENLSDGIIAPLFWWAVLGVEGMLTYKMINTLDSMIGYKNERYLYYGRLAARLDDVANYIPARLTAVLMLLVSGYGRKFGFLIRYGRAHCSPNSGYPEAALAAILNARFGGSHLYFGEWVDKPYIGENERDFTTADMERAVLVNFKVELFVVALLLLGTFLFSYFFG
ncbi:MAG: cobalamin biosynthesis protein CobD [Bacteroidia bacterium]|nr:cobalamin biosynthesis protein CobD [Bacteroidia bacterium]